MHRRPDHRAHLQNTVSRSPGPGAEADWKRREAIVTPDTQSRLDAAMPTPRGREDAACGKGTGPEFPPALPSFPGKIVPQCYFLVPVNLRPKAFPPGDKQGLTTRSQCTERRAQKLVHVQRQGRHRLALRWIPSRHWRVLFSMVGCRARGGQRRGQRVYLWEE